MPIQPPDVAKGGGKEANAVNEKGIRVVNLGIGTNGGVQRGQVGKKEPHDDMPSGQGEEENAKRFRSSEAADGSPANESDGRGQEAECGGNEEARNVLQQDSENRRDKQADDVKSDSQERTPDNSLPQVMRDLRKTRISYQLAACSGQFIRTGAESRFLILALCFQRNGLVAQMAQILFCQAEY